MVRFGLTTMLSLAGAAVLASPAVAQMRDTRPSVAESFPVGTAGPTCQAQGIAMGAVRASIFERKWAILCSGVALPVGTAYALRGGDAETRIAAAREEPLVCSEPTAAPGGDVRACRGSRSGLGWNVYTMRARGTTYVVEGLAGYDSALQLTLASLKDDRIVPGDVQLADVGAGDSLALLRARAAVSDAATLVGEGYRGNSSGAYAEAAEAFSAAPALLPEEAGAGSRAAQLHEIEVNRALQLSNLGSFNEADKLFAQAAALGGQDPVQDRLARNYEAIHLINQGRMIQALAVLDRPVTAIAQPLPANGTAVAIDAYAAAGLNATQDMSLAGVLGQQTRLSPQERAAIIDAQADELRGTILRLQGDAAGARARLAQAHAAALRVRDGRVTSITRLRAQIMSETALSYEAEQRYGEAETLLRRAVGLVEQQYPDSASVNVARARLAGFLVRRGKSDEALGLYRSVVDNVTTRRGQFVGMENLMRPYFDLLATDTASDPSRMADLFKASQLVARPGAADTLTQLARELESGQGDAAALYRRSLDINRDLERSRIALARLNAVAAEGAAPAELPLARERLERLLAEQRDVVSTLSQYPAYRAVASRTIPLADLQKELRPGEAYLKLVELAGNVYALYATADSARGWRVPFDARKLGDYVGVLRGSISQTVNGEQTTYPFEIDAARELYEAMFSPVSGDLPAVKHLIFEPDGAMLELPINLLTGDAKGIAAYHARVAKGGDDYDFTGIDWLGRDRAVSTALSAASFRDAREAPRSAAREIYLGLGQNAPVGVADAEAGVRGMMPATGDAGCDWPIAAWNRPISDAELITAASLFGRGESDLIVGKAFTDTAIMARGDLANYRIVHFATHGLVTAPKVGCPVRPALLTSFGGAQSDGLLSFKEIFDLKLDADLVVLSACDTAGGASLEATQEAGILNGGGQSLDGLVRAFIAAGGRQVIASHWPAPDTFDATRRLFNTFYSETGSSVGAAFLDAQRKLMDDAATSHPFYWAGFAIIGDAAKPLGGS